MFEKFKDDENVLLNNYALGEKKGEKNFNISAQTGASSFNKINQNSEWIEVRSKEYKTSIENFITSAKVNICTLDDYCLKNKIDTIDLLKIDTQGYEDRVMQGGINTLKNKKIKAIVTELMFDNVYEKYFSFSDIEKYLIAHNFRMVGIYLSSNSLFGNLTFLLTFFILIKIITNYKKNISRRCKISLYAASGINYYPNLPTMWQIKKSFRVYSIPNL